MQSLFELKNFKPIADLDSYAIPLQVKGLYSISVKSVQVLPQLFQDELLSNNSPIIYIGVGERSIYERLQEECKGKSNGTFFRGIGALLGYKPPVGSLLDKVNKKNYRFSKTDRNNIVSWMNDNLNFNFIKREDDLLSIEKALIKLYCPILNTTHNPAKSKFLASMRKSCRDHALVRTLE